MKWYAYHLSPIDHNWGYLKGFKDTFLDKLEDVPEDIIDDVQKKNCDIYALKEDCSIYELKVFFADWKLVQKLAKKVGWEGDFVQGPKVFWLPVSEDFTFKYGFVFKQGNNGSVFVVSPCKLDYLLGDGFYKVIES